jgi:hypothetical protein
MKDKRVSTVKSIKISDGLFFPSDFAKLKKNVTIYIKKGLLICPKGTRYKIIKA